MTIDWMIVGGVAFMISSLMSEKPAGTRFSIPAFLLGALMFIFGLAS